MSLPKFYETFIPTLQTLSDGQPMLRRDVPEKILELGLWKLSDDERNIRTRTGQPLFHNRVGWGIAYLKRAGFVVQPERGHFTITEKGKSVLESGIPITLDLLESQAEWKAWQPQLRSKAETENDEHSLEQYTPQELVEKAVNQLATNLRAELHQRLYSIDPYYFQSVILILFQKMGYGDFETTPKSRDGGIDGIIYQDQLGIERIYIQAKRYQDGNKVRELDIRNFIGAMSGDVRKGIFVTTSTFDEAAITRARNDRNNTIILIDGDKLVDLLIKFNVGVQIQMTYEVKMIDEDFFDLS